MSVSDFLASRLNLDLDESDREPLAEQPEPVPTDELISRLRDLGAFVAEADGAPPTRLRHCFTIDLVVAKLRQEK